jgi:hypothetical protein
MSLPQPSAMLVSAMGHLWDIPTLEWVRDTGSGGGGSAPSGTIGAAVPSTASPVAVKDNAGNLQYPKLDASGNLLVAVTGAGSGGTSSVDQSAFVAGTTAGTAVIGVRDDTASSTVAEDTVGIVRMTTNRALHTNLRDASGTELGVAAAPVQVSLANTAANATAVKVDGSAVTQPVSGPLTDAQLRASAVPVSGPLTDTELRASAVAISHANLDVALSTRLKPADTLTKVSTVDTITNVVHVDDNAGSLTVDGTVTANAGTNLNTSLLALEAGGNLATLTAKDFATQATLALIKAKTDNLDVTLSGGGVHVIVDSAPASGGGTQYAEGATTSPATGTAALARVSDTVDQLLPTTMQLLSLTTDGRLRVATADESLNFASWGIPYQYANDIDPIEHPLTAW